MGDLYQVYFIKACACTSIRIHLQYTLSVLLQAAATTFKFLNNIYRDDVIVL